MTPSAPPFRATFRRRHVRSVWMRAFEGFRASRPKGSVALAHSYRRGDSHEEPPDVTEQTARLWVASPTRWRYEIDMPGGTVVNVVDGDRVWSYAPGVHAWSNESDTARTPAPTQHPEAMWLDASALLSGLTITSRRREERAGGEVDVVEAVPAPGHEAPFAPGADSYELVMDPAREVVLRCAASLEGVEFFSFELESLEYGVTLADAMFRIQLPEGVHFGPPPFPRRESLGQRLRGAFRIRG